MESKINVMVRIKPHSGSESIWTKVSDNTLMSVKTKELYSYD